MSIHPRILANNRLYKISYKKSDRKMSKEYRVRRKLQEQSGSYFVVIPKLWVDSLRLKQGDEMDVRFNGIVQIHPPMKEVS
jgi:hypothetical protein